MKTFQNCTVKKPLSRLLIYNCEFAKTILQPGVEYPACSLCSHWQGSKKINRVKKSFIKENAKILFRADERQRLKEQMKCI
jgi:hypothetical protein